MPWLDHGIHSVTLPPAATVLEWIAGSSPAMTTEAATPLVTQVHIRQQVRLGRHRRRLGARHATLHLAARLAVDRIEVAGREQRRLHHAAAEKIERIGMR